MKTINLPTHSPHRPLWRCGLLLIPLLLACFALSPHARAVCQKGCLTNQNTVLGDDALFSLTGGVDNTAIGFNALYSNTTGSQNTANGVNALYSNTDGTSNTATGVSALKNNTTGFDNTANGHLALTSNTEGTYNTAIGFQALLLNTSGSDNTATGPNALLLNTTGNFNTADGDTALASNTTGGNNTAIGYAALDSNTTGSDNIAVGYLAGIGLTTGNANIDIGNFGVGGESNTIRIGTRGAQTKTFIAGISGVTVPGGVGVIIGTNGKLGTVVSSERFKDAIKPMGKTSEAILALKPVTFRYKQEVDPDGIPQFGLVAEDVEKINPDLVARDEQGKPYTVRYEAVNAMLLNEFLKEHRKVESLEKQLKAAETKQEEKISALTELVKEQAAQIQKVSAQLEVNKTASQFVLNNQ